MALGLKGQGKNKEFLIMFEANKDKLEKPEEAKVKFFFEDVVSALDAGAKT